MIVLRSIFFLVVLGLWITAIVSGRITRYLDSCYIAASAADCLPEHGKSCFDLEKFVEFINSQSFCSTVVFLKGVHHAPEKGEAILSFCKCMRNHIKNITFCSSYSAEKVKVIGVQFIFHNIDVNMINITFERSSMEKSKLIFNRVNENMSINNCNFVSSSLHLLDVTLYVQNSNFSKSSSTAITLYSSEITLYGNVSFINNTGTNGGALALIGTAMYIDMHAIVIFQNNHAHQRGGAIFTDDVDVHIYTHDIASFCFYVFINSKDANYGIKLYFTRNSANLGGDHIYGAILKSTCISTDCHCEKSNTTLNRFFSFEPTLNSSLSAISGNPTRVCSCDSNGQPQCTNLEYIFQTGLEVYPGEKFNISVVVVGGDFGTTIGTVYAKLAFTNTSMLSTLDNVAITTTMCTNLTYSVHSSKEREVMFLSTNGEHIKENFSYVCHRSKISGDITDYNKYGKINPSLLTTFTFINITLLSCPPGFSLMPSNRCDCYPSLKKRGFKCVFRGGEGYLSWSSMVWIGTDHALSPDNTTENIDVIVSKLCPLHYCKADDKSIDLLHSSDAQCEFNHSGVLCGGCQPGLSVAIGSTNCISCPNSNGLALLIFFAAAAFLLILAISILNLTVTQGKINGLIFYANVIWSYQVSLSPHRANNLSPFLRAFIAWLNLDFGIETCFVNGLNAYWKAWLQFIFPFYTAFLFLIGLHYSSRISKIFGDRSTPTLATLLFLSCTKLLRTIIAALSFITLTSYPNETRKYVWLVDGNLLYGCSPHIFLLLMAIACLVLLWIPYTTLLFSMQWLRVFDHHRALRLIGKYKPIYDAYFAPLRDGHHYWFGLILLAQCTVLILSSVTFNAPSFGLIGLVVVSTFLFCYLNCMHIYKDKSTMVIESSLHINIILLVSGLQFFRRSIVTTISISLALAEFLIIIFWNIMPNKIKKKLVCLSKKEVEPQRILESSVGKLVPYRNYRDSILEHSDGTLSN